MMLKDLKGGKVTAGGQNIRQSVPSLIQSGFPIVESQGQ